MKASAPHLKPFANDGRLLLGALRTCSGYSGCYKYQKNQKPLEICRIQKSGKPTMVIMVYNGHISLPCCFSILTCYASICGWVKTSVSCQRQGLGGWASTDPRTPSISSIFIQIYFIILCLLYVYTIHHIIYIYTYYGGFLKWGYPNSWMVYSGT